ncbi:MAG: helix-turn-helix transcriptional regulator [Clostridia bacterium]|nr:helix-turn-helix transcriptional regulator [Clostridia bacterium]
MKIFAKRLRELRLEKNLSQNELSIKLKNKIPQPSIAMWELDKREPSLESAVILAQFFNVSLDYLAGLAEFK